MASIEELDRAGLLTGDGERLSFSHDLVREAAYESVPAAIRLSVHDDAARSLGAAGASPVVVAEHLLRSLRDGDASAVKALRDAAERVTDRAPALAVSLLDAALERVSPLAAVRRALAADRADALLAAGRLLEAVTACRALLETERGTAHAPRLWEILTHAALASGTLDEATLDAAESSGDLSPERLAALGCYRALGAALTAVQPDATVAARREEARGRLGRSAYLDSDRLEELARRALDLARRGHDLSAEANALGMLAFALHDHVELDAYRAAAERAIAWQSRATTGCPTRSSPHANAAYAAFTSDRHAEAAAVFAAGRRTAQVLGDDNYLQLLLVTEAHQQLARGDLDAALAGVQTGEALVREIGARPWVDPALVRGHVALLREGPSGARRHLAKATALVQGGTPAFDYGGTARLEVAFLERTGSVREAGATAVGLWEDFDALGLPIEQVRLGPHVVQLAAGIGRADIVQSVVAVTADAAARNSDVPSLAAWALRSRGMAEGDPDVLLEGLRQSRRSLRLPDIAQAAAEAAALLAAHRRTSEARESAHEALDTWAGMDADAEAAWVRAQLRDAGIVTGVRGQRARPRAGWASLTPTEVKVATLVSQARSNPEIADLLVVSRRTVQTHVGNVLAKLGISSRRELVLAAAEGRLEGLGAAAGP